MGLNGTGPLENRPEDLTQQLSAITREIYAKRMADELVARSRFCEAWRRIPPPLTRWQKVKRGWNRFNYLYIERARTRVAMWIAPWLTDD